MTAEQQAPTPSPVGPLAPLARYEQNVVDRITDFNDPHQGWRRLFSELLGTFFLVLAAAGGGMMSHAFPGVISHTAAVTAPALTVMAVILFMGKVSGAHLNPAVSIAFALRRDFPWRRVPGYIVVQLIGATLAALVLHADHQRLGQLRVQLPRQRLLRRGRLLDGAHLDHGPGQRDPGHRLGRPERRRHRRVRGRRYIALAGLWGSPISGASMNPARTFGPDLASTTFTSYWVYIAGPIAGAVIAVGIAFVLRGRGGDKSAAGAAQGELFTEVYESGKS